MKSAMLLKTQKKGRKKARTLGGKLRESTKQPGRNIQGKKKITKKYHAGQNMVSRRRQHSIATIELLPGKPYTLPNDPTQTTNFHLPESSHSFKLNIKSLKEKTVVNLHVTQPKPEKGEIIFPVREEFKGILNAIERLETRQEEVKRYIKKLKGKTTSTIRKLQTDILYATERLQIGQNNIREVEGEINEGIVGQSDVMKEIHTEQKNLMDDITKHWKHKKPSDNYQPVPVISNNAGKNGRSMQTLSNSKEGESVKTPTTLHICVYERDRQGVVSLLSGNDSKELENLLSTNLIGKIYKKTRMMGEIPLFIAALSFDYEMVDLLIGKGAKVSTIVSGGNTVFHLLVKYASFYPDHQTNAQNMMKKLNTKLWYEEKMGNKSKTALPTEGVVNKASQTEELVENTSQTEEMVHTASQTEKEARKASYDRKLDPASQTEEQVNTASQTEENVDTASQTKEKLDTASQTEEKVDTTSETKEKVDTTSEIEKNTHTTSQNEENTHTTSQIEEYIDRASQTETNANKEERVKMSLWYTVNKKGQTALMLAAKRGQPELFKWILELEDVYIKHEHIYERIKCVTFDITELDYAALNRFRNLRNSSQENSNYFPRRCNVIIPASSETEITDNAHGKENATKINSRAPSVIEIICETMEIDKAYQFIDIVYIDKIISEKLKRYKWWLIIWFILHLGFMALLAGQAVVKALLINDSQQLMSTTQATIFVYVVGVLLFVFGIIYLVLEGFVVYNRRPRCIFQDKRNWDYHVLLIVFSLCLVGDAIWFWIQGPQNIYFLVIALVVGCWFLPFFLRPWKFFSVFTTMGKGALVGDGIRFVIIISFDFLAFSFAMYVLYLPTPGGPPAEFKHLGMTVLTMFTLMLGLNDLEILTRAPFPWMTVPLFIIFIVLTYILMFNILIAIMTNTFRKMSKKRGKQWKLHRLAVMVMIEQMLPLRCTFNTGTLDKFKKRYFSTRFYQKKNKA